MKNTIIAETLVMNLTIKNHKDAVINGNSVGSENNAKWQFAMKKLWEACYSYQCACFNNAKTGAPVDNEKAMNAIQEVLDLIGAVNEFKIHRSPEMLAAISGFAIRDTEKLAGEALTVKSQLKNYEKEYENIHAGMNPGYIKALEKNIEEAKATLKALTGTTGSADKGKGKVSYNTFKYKTETNLAQIISEQKAKTWEELEAEEKERKAKKKEAKKAAKAAAKANA